MMEEANSSVPFTIFNITARPFCNKSTCFITAHEVDKRNAITLVRVLVSSLSILGSLSIIVSILWRRILRNPKIHPIFVISVADCVLGVSWVLGGAFWFGGIQHRSWCYLPSLLTVIAQCVTVALTVIYAVVAYRVLKRQNLSDMLAGGSETVRAWAPWKMAVLYLIAWLLPAASVLIIFGVVAARYSLVEKATECSCWCLPFFINIIPVAFPEHVASGQYFYHTKLVVLSSSVILLVVYFVGFATLVVMYWKILRHIRILRESAHSPTSPTVYGTVGELLMKGHSQAKKRVVAFLSAFVITGLANVVLCGIFVFVEATEIHRGPDVAEDIIGSGGHLVTHHMSWPKIVVYTAQSLTAPLQGFLNALVYGWTRDDFVQSGVSPMSRRESRKRLTASVSSDGEGDAGSGLVDSGSPDSVFSSSSHREDRESTRLSYNSRNRQRFRGDINRGVDSGIM